MAHRHQSKNNSVTSSDKFLIVHEITLQKKYSRLFFRIYLPKVNNDVEKSTVQVQHYTANINTVYSKCIYSIN